MRFYGDFQAETLANSAEAALALSRIKARRVHFLEPAS